MSGADPVNRPEHYQTPGGVECIEAIEAMVADMTPVSGVHTAQVLKYIWRHHKKNGVQDLKKARWYLSRLIEHLGG